MAKVDCKVDLVMLWDIKDVLLILHVHCHEFIANFRCMLSVIDKAELLCLDVYLQDWVVLKSYAFALNLLSPSVLIEAFSEEDNVGHHRLVVSMVDSVTHSVQVKCEDFINQHFVSVLVSKVIIISLPLGWVCCWWQSRQVRLDVWVAWNNSVLGVVHSILRWLVLLLTSIVLSWLLLIESISSCLRNRVHILSVILLVIALIVSRYLSLTSHHVVGRCKVWIIFSFTTFVSFSIIVFFRVSLILISRVFSKFAFLVFVFFSLLTSCRCRNLLELSVFVHQLGKLNEMLVDWVLVHVLG